MTKKKCTKCKLEFDVNSDYFHKKKDSKDGFMSTCKECSGGRFTKFHQLKDGEMFCNKCDEILPYTEEYFPIDKSAKDGLRKTCHVCNGRLKGYGAKRKLPPKEAHAQGEYNKPPTIEEVQEYCRSIGGLCVSEEYVNSKTRMNFKCPTCDVVFDRALSDYKDRGTPECGECSRKVKADKSLELRREVYLEETLSICNEINLKLLSKTFDNPHADLEFECSMCNEPFKRKLVVLRETRSSTCHRCSQKIVAENRSYKIEEVRDIFEDEGCYLISTEYLNNKQKLEYVCNCGERDTKALSNFLMGQRCETCAVTKRTNSLRTPYEEVKRIFEEGGCTLLSKEFIRSSMPLDYICECGNESRIKLPAFKYGVRCRKCFAIRNSGENNANWNPNLTQEDREKGRGYLEYTRWRSAVYERDNYTCQCCGEKSGDINAHHKDSFNWCAERRVDVSNGSTLCEHCHCLGEHSFHKTYGFGNNTEQQYNEWIVQYKEENIISKYGTAERKE